MSDFSGLVSSACALASAAAIVPIDSLELCTLKPTAREDRSSRACAAADSRYRAHLIRRLGGDLSQATVRRFGCAYMKLSMRVTRHQCWSLQGDTTVKGIEQKPNEDGTLNTLFFMRKGRNDNAIVGECFGACWDSSCSPESSEPELEWESVSRPSVSFSVGMYLSYRVLQGCGLEGKRHNG